MCFESIWVPTSHLAIINCFNKRSTKRRCEGCRWKWDGVSGWASEKMIFIFYFARKGFESLQMWIRDGDEDENYRKFSSLFSRVQGEGCEMCFSTHMVRWNEMGRKLCVFFFHCCCCFCYCTTTSTSALFRGVWGRVVVMVGEENYLSFSNFKTKMENSTHTAHDYGNESQP